MQSRPYARGTISIGGKQRQRVVNAGTTQEITSVATSGSSLLNDGELARAKEIAQKMARYLPGLHAQPWGSADVLLVARALIQVYEQNSGPPMIGFEKG